MPKIDLDISVRGCSLVEDRDTAQLAAVPFGLIFSELGVDRLQERTHEGNLVCRTDN